MRLALVLALLIGASTLTSQWERHTIDRSSRGADGVRVGDANGDGRPDITTAWEEGGIVRVYLNPGREKVADEWPAVTVGKVASPEDAVFVDLDGDGALDVVSSCEGRTRALFVHWAPRERKQYLKPEAWTTHRLPVTHGKSRWMFAQPMQVDGKRGVDLVVGSKNPGGQVAWLESPEDPRDLTAWRLHEICTAGWIMSLRAIDLDRDGDLDIVASDRKGPGRGVLWLERRGAGAWRRHLLGGGDHEVMFLDVAAQRIVAATRDGTLLDLARGEDGWQQAEIPNPFGVQWGKAVRIGDLDRDGTGDLVCTANTRRAGADRPPGVAWLRRTPDSDKWRATDISGPAGRKFDRIELIDLDQDGDLDVLTCEEHSNLGVIWYENPSA